MDECGGARAGAAGGSGVSGALKVLPMKVLRDEWPATDPWDPQRRVFAAIELSRGALGTVEPLTEMERAQIRDCLTRVGVPAKAMGVVE